MRTTVTIDDQLLRAAKRRAAESGKSLNAVVEDALRTALAPRPAATNPEARPLPVFRGGALLPGVDLDDSVALQDLMEGTDR